MIAITAKIVVKSAIIIPYTGNQKNQHSISESKPQAKEKSEDLFIDITTA
jgi:hypothetical protein